MRLKTLADKVCLLKEAHKLGPIEIAALLEIEELAIAFTCYRVYRYTTLPVS